MKNSSKIINAALILILLIYGVLSCQENGFNTQIYARSPLKGKNKDAPVYQLQKAFHEIYNLYKNSVVFISTEKTVKVRTHPFFDQFFFDPFNFDRKKKRKRFKTRKQTGLGTGFILSKDGYICTNHHVIAKMDSIRVKIGNKEYKARVIGSDARTDIALLKIKGNKEFNPVYLGNSDKIKVGDWAIAIGNPFGLDRTFTVGVISATVRHDEIGNAHIQTDASINPGNSGGPLINLDGEVIGINRMIFSRSGGNLGIGFAIPINTAVGILDQLKKHKKIKRGFIGVQIARLTAERVSDLGLKSPDGALIGMVYPKTPAKEAGIKENDVIIQVGNKKIKGYIDLVNEISKTPIGKRIKLKIWRNKHFIYLHVKIKERK